MSIKNKITVAALSLLTTFSIFTGFKNRTPSAEELINAREALIKASDSYVIDYNKQMVPPKTFIKKGLEGQWDVIKEALDRKKNVIKLPLLWANPLPEDRMKEFKKILSEEFQRILDSNPHSKNLKVKNIELEIFEYDLHHPKGMFGEPTDQFHRIAVTANIHVEKKLF